MLVLNSEYMFDASSNFPASANWFMQIYSSQPYFTHFTLGLLTNLRRDDMISASIAFIFSGNFAGYLPHGLLAYHTKILFPSNRYAAL